MKSTIKCNGCGIIIEYQKKDIIEIERKNDPSYRIVDSILEKYIDCFVCGYSNMIYRKVT